MTYWKYFAAYNGPMAHYVGSGALPNDDDRTIIDRSKHSKHAQTHNRVVALSTADNHLLLAHHRNRSTLNIRLECNAQHAAGYYRVPHTTFSIAFCLSVCLSVCRVVDIHCLFIEETPLSNVEDKQQPYDLVAGWKFVEYYYCLLYTSPSPRDGLLSRMPSSA